MQNDRYASAYPSTITVRDHTGVRHLPALLSNPSPLTADPNTANALAAITQAPAALSVQIGTTYADRAEGFRRSTLPLWWTFSGATAGLVTVVWVVGPLTGGWQFLFGWYIATLIAAIALVSIAVWAWMWRRWHHDSPDAIISRAADARLEMARLWWRTELERTYNLHGDQS